MIVIPFDRSLHPLLNSTERSCRTGSIGYNVGRGTKERQILAEPRQGRKAATVREFLWVFGRATSLFPGPCFLSRAHTGSRSFI